MAGADTCVLVPLCQWAFGVAGWHLGGFQDRQPCLAESTARSGKPSLVAPALRAEHSLLLVSPRNNGDNQAAPWEHAPAVEDEWRSSKQLHRVHNWVHIKT